MIGEAKSAGADYVLTPEMTNILAAKREQLFAAVVEEEADASLATLRELARKLGIYVHIGSLAIKISPDRAANRSFLIDPKGDIVARYDKIHMFDVDLADGESYRESRNYRPGELAVLADLPWGRLGLTVCYDLRFPRSIARWPKPARPCWRFRPHSPNRPAKRIGMCSSAAAPSKTAASYSPRRKAAGTRTAGRLSAIH